MSYSNFKNLDDIKQQFKVAIISDTSLFAHTKPIRISPLLAETLDDNVSLALNINTEKSRSELIIAPMLVEVRKYFNRKISLFSGIEFNVDESQQLSGFCDFILSNSSDQIFLESAVVCVVEAKNENIKSGYPQCIAEMIAAKIFNERQGRPVAYILGVVTTGSNWKFLKYVDETIRIDFEEYLINQSEKILGILVEGLQSVV